MDRTDDQRAIEQLLYDYAWMVDQRLWQMMDSVFAPDATIDYASTGGKKGPYRPTLEWLARALAPWPLNLHHITNVAVSVRGDEAQSRCYFSAPMGRARGDGSQEVIVNAGYYLDTLVRTAAGWRIRERVCRQTIMIGQLPPGYAIPE
ncbi:MAG TPA: nuclear transport factor 2 family protein [Steroidobacteraceae bacterium]|nr:nuclear transport factor 2 family protein [Steroidobacteraceae bacterium]